MNTEGGGTKNNVHLCACAKTAHCFTHKPSSVAIMKGVVYRTGSDSHAKILHVYIATIGVFGNLCFFRTSYVVGCCILSSDMYTQYPFCFNYIGNPKNEQKYTGHKICVSFFLSRRCSQTSSFLQIFVEFRSLYKQKHTDVSMQSQ